GRATRRQARARCGLRPMGLAWGPTNGSGTLSHVTLRRLLTTTLVLILFASAVARAEPPRTPAPSHAIVLTRPGFQMAPDGSSRVCVLAGAMPPYDPRVVGRRVEIRVRGARLGVSNDRAWLDTRYFETPVARARLERRGADAILVCELRGDATPQ